MFSALHLARSGLGFAGRADRREDLAERTDGVGACERVVGWLVLGGDEAAGDHPRHEQSDDTIGCDDLLPIFVCKATSTSFQSISRE